MSKLKEERLLAWLTYWLTQENAPGDRDEEEQAIQQVRERLQKPLSDTSFEIKAGEYERGLADATPAVDEGFVNTWAKEFATATLHDKQMHRRIAYMLREAGIEVKK